MNRMTASQRADEIGDVGLVERDAQAIHAGDEAEAEDEQEQRGAEAESDQARKRGREHQGGADQRREIDRLFHTL